MPGDGRCSQRVGETPPEGEGPSIRSCDGNGLERFRDGKRRRRRKGSTRADFRDSLEVKEYALMRGGDSASWHRQRHFGSLPPEVQEDVEFLEGWVRQMEERLPPLPTGRSIWSKKDIGLKMKELKAVHLEIKSHGQTIKSIVQICDEFRGQKSVSDQGCSGSQQRQSDKADNASRPDTNIGRVIERRWHCLWLQSLEWQCYLEQLTWSPSRHSRKKVKTPPLVQVDDLKQSERPSLTLSDLSRLTCSKANGHHSGNPKHGGDETEVDQVDADPAVIVSPPTPQTIASRQVGKSRKSSSRRRRSPTTKTMNSGCCSSESSSSLTSSVISSNGDDSMAVQPAVAMSTSNSNGDIVDEGSETVKNCGSSETSLASLNREMRMLIRMATAASPTTDRHRPGSKNYGNNNNNNANSTTLNVVASHNNCHTTFSQKLPNCATYFVKHISSSSECEDNNETFTNNRGVVSGSPMISSSPKTLRLVEDPAASDDEATFLDDNLLLEMNDEDLDSLIKKEANDLVVSEFEASDGKLIPVLDFSCQNDDDVDEGTAAVGAKDAEEQERFRKNSIKKLVGNAEKLLFQTVSFSSDGEGVAGGSALELSMYRSHSLSFKFRQLSRYKRSHSFHNYGSGVAAIDDDGGCEASGESTSDEDDEDAEMKSQPNQSGEYNLVLVDDDDGSSTSPPDQSRNAKAEEARPRSEVGDGELLSDCWDQEKYLSEHNYDEPIDVDKTLKLLNFGDDYRNFIGSGESDFSDVGGSSVGPQRASSGRGSSRCARATKRRMRRSAIRGARYDSGSEAEMDDVWKTVLESRTKLNEVKRRFRNCQQGGAGSRASHEEAENSDDELSSSAATAVTEFNDQEFTAELHELSETCQENADCILKLLDENNEKNGTVILKKTERSFKGLLRQWQDTKHLILKRLELSETLAGIITNIKRLEDEVGKVLMGRPPPPVIHNKDDLQKAINDLKGSVVQLTSLKSDLFNVNVEIHNFLADLCVTRRKDSQHSPPQHRIPILRRETITSTGLRNKVVALYALWDEAFHTISSQLANSQSTFAKLLQFEEESHRLSQIVEQTQLARRTKRHSASLTEDSGISEGGGDNNECEEALFAKLRALAQDLESKLTPESNLVQEITQSLKCSANELEESLRRGAAAVLEPISEPDKRLRSRQNNEVATTTVSSSCRTNASVQTQDEASSRPTSGRSGFWRTMMHATVPIQAVFVSSLIMSWILDPDGSSGCDQMLTTMYPQLRYLNGPPPI